ncbi:MAG: hydrogenase maturation protease [Candidatus Zixiibacteriota bacterium]|nr:MAG: hydrogenase maturation protease [candidate division Zixibacteria bacterium]
MKTVILGLGNPILHDDGAGLEAVELLRQAKLKQDVEVKSAAVGGFRILDHLAGYRRAVIVDAMMTGGRPGDVRRMQVEELCGELHASCVHDLSLSGALDLGRGLGMDLPEKIVIYGIEVADPYLLREGCSPEVRAGVRRAVDMILADLQDESAYLVEE